MVPPDRQQWLADLLVRAGRLAQSCRQSLDQELKGDGSIVTRADKEVEAFLKTELQAQIPAGFFGEEFAPEEPNTNGQWVCDPIDGTSNFAFGGPLWGISIGLMVEGTCVLGGIHLADLGETYTAEVGCGVLLNGERLPPIPPGPIEPHQLMCFCDDVLRLVPRQSIPGKMRCPGAMVIAGAFFATQRYRGCIGLREKLYDMAPCVLFARELGGFAGYMDGSDLDLSVLQTGASISRPWLLVPAGAQAHWDSAANPL